MTLSNLHYIDNQSLYDTFGMWIESGSDDFLKIPERKDSVSHDWQDEDGLDIDLDHTYLKHRTISFKCCGMYATKDEFWAKYNAFVNLLRSPGARKLTVTRHNKDYYVHYKDCNDFKTYNFRVAQSDVVLCKFSLVFIELKPEFA